MEEALEYLRDNEVLIRSLSHSGQHELCTVLVDRWDLVSKNPQDEDAKRSLVEAVRHWREHRRQQERRR
jgi:hypothetical protein